MNIKPDTIMNITTVSDEEIKKLTSYLSLHVSEERKLLDPFQPHVRGGHNQNILDILANNEAIIAGGAITSLFSNTSIKDYDIFFRNKDRFLQTKSEFDKFPFCSRTFTTKAALTYELSNNIIVQLIYLPGTFKSSAIELFEIFDFSISMGAYDFSTKEFVLGPDFLKHLAQRVLVFNPKTLFPISTLFRVQKFEKRGFSIDKKEWLKIAFCLQKLQLNTFEDAIDQLIGISTGLTNSLMFNDIKHQPFDAEVFLEMIQQNRSMVPDQLF